MPVQVEFLSPRQGETVPIRVNDTIEVVVKVYSDAVVTVCLNDCEVVTSSQAYDIHGQAYPHSFVINDVPAPRQGWAILTALARRRPGAADDGDGSHTIRVQLQ